MESKLAKMAEQALVEATQRLSPEERVNAHLAHCRLVMELYEAGRINLMLFCERSRFLFRGRCCIDSPRDTVVVPRICSTGF
jgi:hypothetical protein